MVVVTRPTTGHGGAVPDIAHQRGSGSGDGDNIRTYQQQREADYQRLKQALLGCWSRLKEPDIALFLLREVAQQFIGWTLPETLSAEDLLQHMERAAVLSPNAVSLLSQLCEVIDSKDGGRLVQDYENKYPPVTTAGQDGRNTGKQPWSAPAAFQLGSKSSDSDLYHSSQTSPRTAEWDRKERFSSDSTPPTTGHGRNECSSSIACGERDWYSTNPSTRGPTVPLVIPDASDLTTSESVWRTKSSGREWPESELGGGGSGSVWSPPESVQYGRLTSGETEESRQRSMALWGHAASSPAPRQSPRSPWSPPHAVCECYLPHQPAATQRHHNPRQTTTVAQVLDLPPKTTSSSGSGARMSGVTPAGARRAGLVDFLCQRLGPRYHQLGEALELVSSSELAALSSDTSSDLVTRARRLLQLYLSRNPDGNVEEALIRRLRRIRFNRLADELELWSFEQDQQEDPRDWPEDKRRWQDSRHDHPTPGRRPRMACC